MNIYKELKEKIEKHEVVLCTVKDKEYPNSIVVGCVKVLGDSKILITDNYMHQTLMDIQQNPNVILLFWDDERSYKLIGQAQYSTEGKYLEIVKNMESNKGYPCKGVLVISISKLI